jgi:hypothetical protein
MRYAMVNGTLTIKASNFMACSAMATNDPQIKHRRCRRLEYATGVYALEGRSVWP